MSSQNLKTCLCNRDILEVEYKICQKPTKKKSICTRLGMICIWIILQCLPKGYYHCTRKSNCPKSHYTETQCYREQQRPTDLPKASQTCTWLTFTDRSYNTALLWKGCISVISYHKMAQFGKATAPPLERSQGWWSNEIKICRQLQL